MILFKIFLLLVLTVGFIIFAFSMRLRTFQKLVVITAYLILVIFIVFPEYADAIAHLFSIESGTNLVIYIFIAVTTLIDIVLHVAERNDHIMITTMIREDAKRNATMCK